MKEVFKAVEERMQQRVSGLENEYMSIRAGRANPAVLDRITVDYYGSPTPINQMAAIAVSEARVLTIQPWDMSSVRSIEKALQKSDLGINPQSDGKIIRLVFPPLTEERRREIAKDISKMAEEAKVSVRNMRRDAIEKLKAMKKSSEITEDDLKQGEKKIQELTDRFCKEVDSAADRKEKEVMEL